MDNLGGGVRSVALLQDRCEGKNETKRVIPTALRFPGFTGFLDLGADFMGGANTDSASGIPKEQQQCPLQ